MIFALAGNQNCGKTTLFNQLTGAKMHVGNFPGVTVERKSGEVRGRKNCTVVDLPGIYSLRPYTAEEIVTRDFLTEGRPDAIINIVDATNPERNLYLTLQLLTLQVPTVVALNMMDELTGSGGSVNAAAMARKLGVPVVPICAASGDGVEELIAEAVRAAEQHTLPKVQDFCPSGPVHRCIHAVCRFVENRARQAGIPARFAAERLMEGETGMAQRLGLDAHTQAEVERAVLQMERERGLDRNAALADMRYSFLEALVNSTVVKPRQSREKQRSERIDRVLTGKYTAIPVFLGVMLLIFYLTFAVIGKYLSDLLAMGIDGLTGAVDGVLTVCGADPVVHSLLIDGIFAGVGSVLGFLPIIVTLFFFLSVLEDTGYMARIAFVMDRPLRKLGLSGRSIVPMLLGFGCTVPAVMAARTLPSQRDRITTILLTPFMSCSAKIPIYAFFSEYFFPGHAALVMMGLYVLGIAAGILYALVLKTAFRGRPVPFVMELPNYRMPGLRSVMRLLWNKAKDFLQRAFTVIFLASVVVWFLQSFDTRLSTVTDASDSLLAAVGRFLAPVFRPLGFGDWRCVTALLSGFIAKETVVSTLEVLLGGTAVTALFSTKTAVSYLVFVLLYTPCVAAVAAIRREVGSRGRAVCIAVIQCCAAYLAAFLVNRLSAFL